MQPINKQILDAYGQSYQLMQQAKRKNDMKTTDKIDIPILWKKIGVSNDDFVAHFFNYTLRVEKMDTERWWYNVYYDATPLSNDSLIKTTERQAKVAAIQMLKNALEKKKL